MYGSQVYVEKMGRLTIHERLRVITLFSCGHSVSSIRKRLAEENVSISLKSLYNLLKKYREKDTIVDLPHQRRRRIITDEMRAFIELEMANNDKLTSRRMKTLLCENGQTCMFQFPPLNGQGKIWVGFAPSPTIVS